jgi:uncharacterized protein YkwD
MRGKSILQVGLTGLGPLLLALLLWLLPLVPSAPAQALPAQPDPGLLLQARAAVTVYLPLVIRSPTQEEQLLTLINAERQSRGLGTLTANPTMNQVAESHSIDMYTRGFFDHTNPDGVTAAQRLTNAGYNWHYFGETIARGPTSAASVFSAWMNSPGHRAILLSPNYTEIGLGYVRGGYHWTADFARPW